MSATSSTDPGIDATADPSRAARGRSSKWALIQSLQSQVTQLQGALAQAGTELSLAKVETSLIKCSTKYVEHKIEVPRAVEELKQDLLACQAELNALRKSQSVIRSDDVLLAQAEMSEVLSRGIVQRVGGWEGIVSSCILVEV